MQAVTFLYSNTYFSTKPIRWPRSFDTTGLHRCVCGRSAPIVFLFKSKVMLLLKFMLTYHEPLKLH